MVGKEGYDHCDSEPEERPPLIVVAQHTEVRDEVVNTIHLAMVSCGVVVVNNGGVDGMAVGGIMG